MSKKRLFTPARLTTGLAGLAALLAPTAMATTETWNAASAAAWDTSSSNWTPNATFTSGDDAIFDATSTQNVTSASGLTIGSISMNTGYTGTVTMSGANTVNGTTTINAGTLSYGATGALGASAITLNGGTLQNSGGADVTLANAISVGSGGGTIKLGVAKNLSLTGTLSGSGNLSLGGSGPLSSIYLSFTSNTLTGTITIPNAGNNNTVIRFQAATASSASADWVIGGPSDRGTTLGTAEIYNFGSLAGSGYIAGNNTSSTATLSIGGNDHSATFSGSIQNNHNSAAGMTLAVTKVGAGTETLSGVNTYTGATTVNAGTLALGVNNAISSSSAMVLNGGTFATGGFSETLNTLTLSSTSTIDFGLGTSALAFANSSAISWTGTLNLTNFDVGTDTLKFGTDATGLTGSQLSAISLSGYTATGLDSSGFVTFTAVPEPHEFALAIMGLLGVMIFIRRRNQQA
jgi:autotransporter-associated beta strand protein